MQFLFQKFNVRVIVFSVERAIETESDGCFYKPVYNPHLEYYVWYGLRLLATAC
jgi:hypothetical protein